MAAKKTKKDRVEKKQSPKGKVYISATFNNTLITITDMDGNTLVWGSSGNAGYKGTRKSTPYAATTATDKVIKKAKEENALNEVEIYVKGPGPGRDAALRAIRAAGLRISLIADVTPIPHNGPLPKKKRRL